MNSPSPKSSWLSCIPVPLPGGPSKARMGGGGSCGWEGRLLSRRAVAVGKAHLQRLEGHAGREPEAAGEMGRAGARHGGLETAQAETVGDCPDFCSDHVGDGDTLGWQGTPASGEGLCGKQCRGRPKAAQRPCLCLGRPAGHRVARPEAAPSPLARIAGRQVLRQMGFKSRVMILAPEESRGWQ